MDRSEILARATAPEGHPSAMPKSLLIFAHPDDEVVALGARLGRFGTARFVHATDGAPRNEQDSRTHGFATLDDYRMARAQELGQALCNAGLSGAECTGLDIPDQEASLRLLDLTSSIARLLQNYRPEVIFTHPYEGGHPDHDACAFAVHHALALQKNGSTMPIIESTFYHRGPQGVVTGEFLAASEPTPETAYRLSSQEQQRKRSLIQCFVTQQETLGGIPLHDEKFRIAPTYNFRKPPHAAPVLYDTQPWGMTSQRFCQLAAEAENALRKKDFHPCQ
ncbi:MAG TPA: PIG-L family deacetylase [Silvibacterium sp.]|nr:PIG-L family deacetylase [Silvibacterium sp.]